MRRRYEDMVKPLALAAFLSLTLTVGAAQAQPERKTPYWASISATKAAMRRGPGRNYPQTWIYIRPDLPIRIVETYPDWRKVQDPDGETGWMLQRLLSDTRTGYVTGGEPRPLHAEPDAGSPVRYHAEPGVVGRISHCGGGWCLMEVGSRGGYIRTEHFWGADPNESLD